MAEGDTIHDLAARLRSALGDGPLVRFEAPRLRVPHPAPGEHLDVKARGKHLLVGFEGGLTLHTHLGMDGWWRVERGAGPPIASDRRPGAGPQARISTARASAVAGDTRAVELLDAAGLRRHAVLRALGPDLCDEAYGVGETLRRLLATQDGATPIGLVLLDQRPASGIGNVYRSEVLWAERVAPRTPLERLDDEQRRRLYETAHRLLRANLGSRRPRRTLPSGLAVYGRAGRPCPRCGTAIRTERLGDQARSVWWCPSCQLASGSRPDRGEAATGSRTGPSRGSARS